MGKSLNPVYTQVHPGRASAAPAAQEGRCHEPSSAAKPRERPPKFLVKIGKIRANVAYKHEPRSKQTPCK